jgi:hypothetical protein
MPLTALIFLVTAYGVSSATTDSRSNKGTFHTMTRLMTNDST